MKIKAFYGILKTEKFFRRAFMKYTVLPSYVWTYPDVHDYKEGKDCAKLISLRDSYATFQVHLYDLDKEKTFHLANNKQLRLELQ